MDRLRVDTAELRETGARLRAVADEFVQAPAHAADGAAVAGHPDLAAALTEFVDGWNHRRDAMVERIAELAEATRGVGEGFERIDQELGAALRGTSS